MSTPDKTHDSGDVPETDFGEKEQAQLAELLGDECKNCSCMSYPNSPLPYCICCGGTGKTKKRVPTGLALIEACRKRGVQISVDTFGDGYAVLSSANWCDGEFLHKGLRYCDYEELESAIAIAAMRGLESVANSESAN